MRKTYRTKRLELRPYKLADFAAWVWGHQNFLPKKNKYDWQPPRQFHPTRKQFREVMLRQHRKAKAGTTYIYPVFKKSTGAWIGVIDIHILNRDELQVANLGYRINNLYQGQGFAKEALTKIIPAILKDLKLNRLEAVIDLDNKASIALTRSVGMAREGVRKNYYYQNGKWDDQVIYIADRKRFGLPPLHPKN